MSRRNHKIIEPPRVEVRDPVPVELRREVGDEEPIVELPSLDSYSLADLDEAARLTIETYKDWVRRSWAKSGGFFATEYLWDEPLWYRRPHDAWIDESWWIQDAEEACRAVEWPILALEVLLANGRDEYRPQALAIIEEWQTKYHGCDDEGWLDLLAFFYPDNEIAKTHIEAYLEGWGSVQLSLLLRLGLDVRFSHFTLPRRA
jgi:hypothetical protein